MLTNRKNLAVKGTATTGALLQRQGTPDDWRQGCRSPRCNDIVAISMKLRESVCYRSYSETQKEP